ncbi:hypothetical protein C1H69_18080 [Billgrantia endophytica]|uniref:Uncharacterized protein n=1 Tax=Billgrantia endophytica TaxID=2033802 RepID=A0A2N7TYJ2_9GAMM|nr:hypothetical protein C1H69_18080 [Halomonas endophytica]
MQANSCLVDTYLPSFLWLRDALWIVPHNRKHAWIKPGYRPVGPFLVRLTRTHDAKTGVVFLNERSNKIRISCQGFNPVSCPAIDCQEKGGNVLHKLLPRLYIM